MSILKTAQNVRALRNTQKAMAVEGDHRGAWNLAPDVRDSMYRLARSFVGQSIQVYDNPIGRLIIEFACEAAVVVPEMDHSSKLKAALRSANRDSQQDEKKERWYTALRKAKAVLPDIDHATRILWRTRNNIK